MEKLIDLHTHTTASDGSFAPKEFIELCKSNNIAAVAVTDHDTTAALDECNFWGTKYGVEVINGIEISCKFGGELHMLGLFLDLNSSALSESGTLLNEFRKERNLKMIAKLSELTDLTADDVSRHAASLDSVGRPHMAQALVDKGYAVSISEAFDKYLVRSAPAYAPLRRFTIRESIDLIHRAGGIAVLAHPNHSAKSDDLEVLVKLLKDYGVDAVECFHSSMPEHYSAHALKLCKKYNLGITAGSDFHGSFKDNVHLGKTYGEEPITYPLLSRLKTHCGISE